MNKKQTLNEWSTRYGAWYMLRQTTMNREERIVFNSELNRPIDPDMSIRSTEGMYFQMFLDENGLRQKWDDVTAEFGECPLLMWDELQERLDANS